MAGKNRFKSTGPKIDFNDPSVLTVVPDHIEEKEVENTPVPEVKPVVAEAAPSVEVKVEPKKVEEKPVAKTKPGETSAVPVEELKPEQPAEEPKPIKENLLAGIVEQKPAGKTYALYLDSDVVAALDKLAKQNKVSRSKALNSLLRNILCNR